MTTTQTQARLGSAVDEAKQAYYAMQAATERWTRSRRVLIRELVKHQRGETVPDAEAENNLSPAVYDAGEDECLIVERIRGRGMVLRFKRIPGIG